MSAAETEALISNHSATSASGRNRTLTIEPDVVGFHKGLLDLAVLHQEGVPLATVVSEDGGAVKAQVQSLGELAGRVAQEADLESTSGQFMITMQEINSAVTYTALAIGVQGVGPRLGPIV